MNNKSTRRVFLLHFFLILIPFLTYCQEDRTGTGGSESSHGNKADPAYDIVFNQSEILEFHIIIDSEHWEEMRDDLEELLRGHSSGRRHSPGDLARNPLWVPCTIMFSGMTWDHVGIRFKGNSSLRSAYDSGNKKFSFKLDFDEFEEDYPEINNQRFFGFKQLNLNNNFSDVSLMREKTASDLFRDFGLVSAQTAFCVVHVDFGEGSRYFGVYTLVEEIDDTVLESQFEDDSGNLYKPEGDGASFAAGKYNKEDMGKKSNEDEIDYSDVEALYEILNSRSRIIDRETWKGDLENVFNVDGFLKWLAANTVMQNWDTYGNMTHNFFLYTDPGTGLLNWIPWDNNESLQSGKRGGGLDLDLRSLMGSSAWPLIGYLVEDSEYKSVYDDYVRQFTGDVFDPEKMGITIDAYYDLLKDYAYREERGYSFIPSDRSFDSAVEGLKSHIIQRNSLVRDYLDSSP